MTGKTFKELEREGWSAMAGAYDDWFATITRQAVAPTLDRLLDDWRGQRFLDVCCGTGHLAAAAAVRGAVAQGVDLAEPMVERARANHPEVASGLNNLAQFLKATNRLTEAEPLYRRALATHEQFFGAEHPRVAHDLKNLSLFLQLTNRFAEAEPLKKVQTELEGVRKSRADVDRRVPTTLIWRERKTPKSARFLNPSLRDPHASGQPSSATGKHCPMPLTNLITRTLLAFTRDRSLCPADAFEFGTSDLSGDGPWI